MEEMLYVFLFTFFFSLSLSFTLVAASISHFLTAAKKFSCYSSNEIGLLCFFLSLAPAVFIVTHVNLDIKFKSKERIGVDVVVVFYISRKVRVAMRFTAETPGYLKCKISPRLT